jgi:hypothetical protein
MTNNNAALQAHELIAGSPWRNAYWFARMLLNGDKYGGVGKSKERQLGQLVVSLETIIAQSSLSAREKTDICKTALTKVFSGLFKPGAKGHSPSMLLAEDIGAELESVEDVVVFIVAVKYIVAPMNAALAAVPSDDAAFCRATAVSILDTLGEAGVGKVINTWDDLGVKGCLDTANALCENARSKCRARTATRFHDIKSRRFGTSPQRLIADIRREQGTRGSPPPQAGKINERCDAP